MWNRLGIAGKLQLFSNTSSILYRISLHLFCVSFQLQKYSKVVILCLISVNSYVPIMNACIGTSVTNTLHLEKSNKSLTKIIHKEKHRNNSRRDCLRTIALRSVDSECAPRVRAPRVQQIKHFIIHFPAIIVDHHIPFATLPNVHIYLRFVG